MHKAKVEATSDSEEEEEVMYVLAAKEAVEGDDENVYFSKILGVETEAPIMQINSKFYKGEWAKCSGTNLFFEEDSNHAIADPIFSQLPDKILKHVCSSRKILNLSRIILKRNDDRDDVELEERADSIEEAFARLQSCVDLKNPGSDPPISETNDDEKHVIEGAPAPPRRSRILTRRVSREYDDVALNPD